MGAGGCYKLFPTVQRRRADNQKSEVRDQKSDGRGQPEKAEQAATKKKLHRR
jgi:hypothetical protein